MTQRSETRLDKAYRFNALLVKADGIIQLPGSKLLTDRGRSQAWQTFQDSAMKEKVLFQLSCFPFNHCTGLLTEVRYGSWGHADSAWLFAHELGHNLGI